MQEKLGHIPTRKYQLPESRNTTPALPPSQCVESRGRPRARAAAEALRRSTSATANPTAAAPGIGRGGASAPNRSIHTFLPISSLPTQKTDPRLGGTLDFGGRGKLPHPSVKGKITGENIQEKTQ